MVAVLNARCRQGPYRESILSLLYLAVVARDS